MRTICPVGVRRPVAESARQVTTVSDSSLAAYRKRLDVSKPMKRGVLPWLATFSYDYNFEMMRLAMAICASRPPGNKRASSCTLTSP